MVVFSAFIVCFLFISDVMDYQAKSLQPRLGINCEVFYAMNMSSKNVMGAFYLGSEDWLAWCGLLINTSSLALKVDYTRYTQNGEKHLPIYMYKMCTIYNIVWKGSLFSNICAIMLCFSSITYNFSASSLCCCCRSAKVQHDCCHSH